MKEQIARTVPTVSFPLHNGVALTLKEPASSFSPLAGSFIGALSHLLT
jgi:hypothetical protein